jgi:hypothetical protein
VRSRSVARRVARPTDFGPVAAAYDPPERPPSLDHLQLGGGHGTAHRSDARAPEGVSKLFLERLDDEELAILERALDKVTLDCSFG